MEQLQPPGGIRNLFIISRFELVRLFQTPRGLMSIAAFAIIWYFILRYAIFEASKYLSIPGAKDFLGDAFGQVGMRNLLEWPVAEFTVFWLFSVFLFPLLTLLITADQTSSDRSRGTLRFLTLRASRDSIFFGRYIGQMVILALLLFGVLTATFLMSLYNNSENWLPALHSAGIMGINLLIVVLPFTAMMALFSATVKSSRMAVTIAIIWWGVTVGLIGFLSVKWPVLNPVLEPLSYIVPGKQLFDLIQSNNWETLNHIWLPLLQTAGFLFLGRTVVARSSL